MTDLVDHLRERAEKAEHDHATRHMMEARRERDEAIAERDMAQESARIAADSAYQARVVIAAAVAALKSRSTGDLVADVTGLVALSERDQSAEIADLRDSLDRLRARVEACGVACSAPVSVARDGGGWRLRDCNECPECLLIQEVRHVE